MSTETNFTIGFIGLGLIGGSIAKNVRRVFPNYTVIGYDTDKEALKKAVEEGVLDRPAAELNSCPHRLLPYWYGAPWGQQLGQAHPFSV